jgi:quinohemoprotein ethanol dehydrogenase
LVYIPAQEIPGMFSKQEDFVFTKGMTNLGISLANVAPPEDPEELKKAIASVHGYLIGWDPLIGKARWSREQVSPVNGGLMSTAGNLLFQGRGDGKFAAHRADNGEELWTHEAQTGLIAPPITYEIDGKQYVSIMAGWGGGFSLAFGPLAAQLNVRNISRILTYSLEGTEVLPAIPDLPALSEPLSLPEGISKERIQAGKDLYHDNCMVCHGAGAVGGGTLPDLRISSPAIHDAWRNIVIEGALRAGGMPAFKILLNDEAVESIRLYIIKRANDFYRLKRSQDISKGDN